MKYTGGTSRRVGSPSALPNNHSSLRASKCSVAGRVLLPALIATLALLGSRAARAATETAADTVMRYVDQFDAIPQAPPQGPAFAQALVGTFDTDSSAIMKLRTEHHEFGWIATALALAQQIAPGAPLGDEAISAQFKRLRELLEASDAKSVKSLRAIVWTLSHLASKWSESQVTHPTITGLSQTSQIQVGSDLTIVGRGFGDKVGAVWLEPQERFDASQAQDTTGMHVNPGRLWPYGGKSTLLVESWADNQVIVEIPLAYSQFEQICVKTAANDSSAKFPCQVEPLETDVTYNVYFFAGWEQFTNVNPTTSSGVASTGDFGIRVASMTLVNRARHQLLGGSKFRSMVMFRELGVPGVTADTVNHVARDTLETGALEVTAGFDFAPSGLIYSTAQNEVSLEVGVAAWAGLKQVDQHFRHQDFFGLRFLQGGRLANGTRLDVGGGWSADFNWWRWKIEGEIDLTKPLSAFVLARGESTFREHNPDVGSIELGIRGDVGKLLDLLK